MVDLQALVDRARTDTGQFAPERPVRIGDTFAVVGLRTSDPSTVTASEVWDISSAARRAAKAAMYGAVASTVDRQYEAQMAISDAALEVTEAEGDYDVRQEGAVSKTAPLGREPEAES